MNLLNNGGSKKKWIIGGITAFVILLIILIIVFWDKIVPTPNPEDTEPDTLEEYIPSGTGNFRPDRTEDGFVVDDKTQFVTPNQTDEEMEVISYTDEGTYMAFVLKGKDGKLYQYAIEHETIVFDAKQNKIILTSKLDASKGVKVLSSYAESLNEGGTKRDPKDTKVPENEGNKPTEDGKDIEGKKDTSKPENRTTTHKVVAVIPNAPDNLHYTPVYSVEKTKDYVYILNLETKTRYKLSRDARTVNVLNGLEISENDIVFGDRLFIYEGDTVPEYKFIEEEDDFISPELVDSLTTTEGKNSKYFKTVEKEEDLLSNEFKTVDVAEVYVYPQTAP